MTENEVAITTMFQLSKQIYDRVDNYTERLNSLLWGEHPVCDEKKAEYPESIHGTIEKQRDIQNRLNDLGDYLNKLEEKEKEDVREKPHN